MDYLSESRPHKLKYILSRSRRCSVFSPLPLCFLALILSEPCYEDSYGMLFQSDETHHESVEERIWIFNFLEADIYDFSILGFLFRSAPFQIQCDQGDIPLCRLLFEERKDLFAKTIPFIIHILECRRDKYADLAFINQETLHTSADFIILVKLSGRTPLFL